MSAETHEPHAHAGAHDAAPGHASLRGYLIGFGLSVILTAVPFWLVMTLPMNPMWIAVIVLGMAAVQIVVHMVFFLHMNFKAEGGWSMLALIFTGILVVIALFGSIWVMYHMNANMMPVDASTMSSMP